MGRLGALIAVGIGFPVFLAIGCAIALEDGWPVLFRQIRVGEGGKSFKVLKFRSMRKGQKGSSITASGDKRVTFVGAILRRYKLDELPQLWNLVRGEMNLIGPRPEVPKYVDADDPLWCSILALRPGITSIATLLYRNEEELLARAAKPEEYYRQVLLPEKLRLNIEYARRRSLLADLKLIFLTARYSFFPATYNSEEVKRQFLSPTCIL